MIYGQLKVIDSRESDIRLRYGGNNELWTTYRRIHSPPPSVFSGLYGLIGKTRDFGKSLVNLARTGAQYLWGGHASNCGSASCRSFVFMPMVSIGVMLMCACVCVIGS